VTGSHSTAADRPPRALVIEDEASSREAFASLLEGAGYEVHCAADGTSGMAQVRSVSPDVVITDVDIPPPNGIAVARAIHNDLSLRHIIVVAASGLPLSQADARQFVAVFSKPVDSEELLLVLRLLLISQDP
jgi:CheY-like chemotaxis protein